MASPFRFFRKNQKLMLALLCGMAMIAFVFLPPLAGTMDSSRGGGSRGGIRTAYGDLSEAELSLRVQSRSVLQSVLNQVHSLALQKVQSGASESMPKRRPLPFQEGERGALDSLILAQTAERLGFVVPDDTVNAYLSDLTGDNVSQAEFQQIVRSSRGYNENLIFEALRDELLALELMNAFYMAKPSTPAEWWNVYRQLHDQVTIEFVPVHVEDFIHQIDDPSEEEIEELYDAYKNQTPRPDQIDGVLMKSPLPGFKQPRQSRFQYVRADFVKMAELATEAVTDEEVKKYYDENLDNFLEFNLPATDSSSDEPTTEGADRAVDETPAVATEPETAAPDAPAATAEAAEDGPRPGKPPEPPAGPAAGDQGSRSDSLSVGGSVFSLTAYQDPAETATGAAGRPPEPPLAADSQADQSSATEAAATASDPPAAATADPPAGPAFSPPPDEAATAPGAPQEETLVDGEAPPSYQPLEEVQDKIRRTIGEQNALQYAVQLLAKVRVPMESYFEARSTWEVNQMDIPEGQQPTPPPTPPNLEELVGDLPLATGTTELLSVFELFETPLGSSVQLSDSRTVFAALAMADPEGPSNLFQPFLTQDGERNLYLSWKVADQPERVPSLEEIRDQVIQYKKTEQAREKAKQRAEELATSARKLGLTLQESLAEIPHLEVGRSEAFTWLTGGPVPRMQSAPLRLSEIEGIEGADPAFMEQIFQLETGEITSVENHAGDVVYVVRLASRGLPLDALRDRFSSDYQMAASLADRAVLNSMRAALIQQISQDAELEIIR